MSDRRRMFDEWARDHDRSVRPDESYAFAGYERVLERIVTVADVHRGHCVLGAGTGTGNLAIRAASPDCKIRGVDFPGAMLTETRKRMPRIHFVRAELPAGRPSELPERFDQIASAYVPPNLNAMYVFATTDHVQTAIDKPHIHQAFDGFRETTGLPSRINPDCTYVEALTGPGEGSVIPDNPEPAAWMVVRNWGYRAPGDNLAALVWLAAISEIRDRSYYDVRDDDLDGALEKRAGSGAP